MTRAEKLAEARRLLDSVSGWRHDGAQAIMSALRLTLDLIETEPKPAPALVRDEAWWRMQAQRVLIAANPKVTDAGTGEADLPKAAALLRATFGQDPASTPAFDVEALVAGVQPYWAKHGCTVYDAIRAVAREMLKGGVK